MPALVHVQLWCPLQPTWASNYVSVDMYVSSLSIHVTVSWALTMSFENVVGITMFCYCEQILTSSPYPKNTTHYIRVNGWSVGHWLSFRTKTRHSDHSHFPSSLVVQQTITGIKPTFAANNLGSSPVALKVCGTYELDSTKRTLLDMSLTVLALNETVPTSGKRVVQESRPGTNLYLIQRAGRIITQTALPYRSHSIA